MSEPYPTNIEAVVVQATTGDAKLAKAVDDRVTISSAGDTVKVHASDKPMLKKVGIIS